jgi:hypothetical protein
MTSLAKPLLHPALSPSKGRMAKDEGPSINSGRSSRAFFNSLLFIKNNIPASGAEIPPVVSP